MNKMILGAVAVAVVAAGVGFVGGSTYQKSKAATMGGAFGRPMGAQGARRGGTGNGFIGGEVLSKDASSVTLKLMAGGSSIVYISPATSIEKATSGSWEDIKVGSSITVRGTQGTDGTYTAQSVQLSRMPLRGSPPISPVAR